MAGVDPARIPKQSNEDRKAEKITRLRERAHIWRVRVWAESERRIRGFEAELAAMGRDADPLFEPDFEDESMLEHYAELTTK